MAKKVLITGGAGFIGSHLADGLLEHGHSVRVLDNLSPQVHPDSQRPAYLSREDVVYSNVPEAHAEALAHLVPLWKAVGNEEQAREARETLLQRHGNSKWAKQAQ